MTRHRVGRGFAYRDAEGRPVADEQAISRIRSLAIPPAWTDVWISPSPSGHLQATGRDARGRKQYRYHPAFRRRRDAGKFDRLIELGERLPALRRRVDRDLGRRGLPRDKVLAAIVRLLEQTALRVGNEEYARLNRSFGLTTLRNRHARVARGAIQFRFRAKAGKVVQVDVDDRRLAAVVRRTQELPGQALFEYLDPDPHPIDSDDVNDYLREVLGGDFSAKDLRTWAGTMRAFQALRRRPDDGPPRRAVLDGIREAAAALGNTPAVARSSYIHPDVLGVFLEGRPLVAGPTRPGRGEELALIRLVRRARQRRGRLAGDPPATRPAS